MADSFAPDQQPRLKDKKKRKAQAAAAKQAAPSTFSLLYESRDKLICVFEDEDGHISAVNPKRLA